jgi:ABC-2 type transport system permease protein
MILRALSWRWAALRNGLLDAMAYRFEFLFGIAGSAIVPLIIQLLLWSAVFSQPGQTELGGMTHHELLMYTFTSVLFSQVRGGDLDFELAEMIRTGQLSSYLLRPVSVIEFVYLRGSAQKFLIAFLALLAGIVFVLATGGSFWRLIGAMGLALLGNVIHFQLSSALAAAAFYWEEAYSVLMVKNMVVSLLCGELIPLSLFPKSWEWVWKGTPFYLYVYGPTQYTLGKWSHAEFWAAMLTAGGWIVISTLLVRLSWGVGMKRYSSIGG